MWNLSGWLWVRTVWRFYTDGADLHLLIVPFTADVSGPGQSGQTWAREPSPVLELLESGCLSTIVLVYFFTIFLEMN